MIGAGRTQSGLNLVEGLIARDVERDGVVPFALVNREAPNRRPLRCNR
jgi:hypothetical protein